MADNNGNLLAAIATGALALLAVWVKSKFEHIGQREGTLASAEQQFRNDLVANYERMATRVKTLETDQAASYARVIELEKRNAALDRTLAKKDEIIAEKLEEITSFRMEITLLEKQVTELQKTIESWKGDGG